MGYVHAEIQDLEIDNKIKTTIQLFVQVTRSHAIWQLVHFWRGKTGALVPPCLPRFFFHVFRHNIGGKKESDFASKNDLGRNSQLTIFSY